LLTLIVVNEGQVLVLDSVHFLLEVNGNSFDINLFLRLASSGKLSQPVILLITLRSNDGRLTFHSPPASILKGLLVALGNQIFIIKGELMVAFLILTRLVERSGSSRAFQAQILVLGLELAPLLGTYAFGVKVLLGSFVAVKFRVFRLGARSFPRVEVNFLLLAVGSFP